MKSNRKKDMNFFGTLLLRNIDRRKFNYNM